MPPRRAADKNARAPGRKHEGSAATAPAEFFQNGREKDGEGMPDAINQGHADNDDADNDPGVGKPGISDYHWPILTNFKGQRQASQT